MILAALKESLFGVVPWGGRAAQTGGEGWEAGAWAACSLMGRFSLCAEDAEVNTWGDLLNRAGGESG